uniref:DAGKc domain-containing protein n=1 Tax=Parastrongyloides trichosuri TaxID=131310 RepID=A0A0N5A3P7_PARTI
MFNICNFFCLDNCVSKTSNNVLIFLNPKSGAGTSIRDFNQKLLPALKENNIGFEAIVTEGKNHCFEVAKHKQNLNAFKAVIIMSGDGLVFEWVNGIYQRNDKSNILSKLPIGIVPTGSGNGLLSSVLSANNQSLQKNGFQERAIKNVSNPSALSSFVNLMHIETIHKNYVAFLSVGWGLLADIDIESERWRKALGSNRFFVEAVIKTIKLKTYKGKLWYYKKDLSSSYEDYNEKCLPVYSNNETLVTIDSLSIFDEDDSFHPEVLDDNYIEKNVPSLNETLPRTWKYIEEEFLFIYAVTISHISRDGFYMPNAKLDDSSIYLTYCLRKDIPSRFSIVQFLSDIENGNHLKHSFVKCIPVSSFRLESFNIESPIVVDGEIIETSKIQASMTDLKINVISK